MTTNGYVEINDCSAFVIIIERTHLFENINNWGKFVFLPNLILLNILKDILEGDIVIGMIKKKIPMIRLNEIIKSIGIDAHDFSDNFTITQRKVPGSREILFGGSEDIRLTMSTISDAYAIPNERGHILFRDKASMLIVPDRIRFNTAHIISMMLNTPVLSNIFYAIKLREDNENKLKILISNSYSVIYSNLFLTSTP